jgi:hypothetical protein
MKIHIKAAFLSALVFPGIGQLYKGDRVKGVMIFVCVNILLLISICLALQRLLPLIFLTQGSGFPEMTKILERLRSGGAASRLLLEMLGGLWFYSWIDASLGKKRGE